MNIFYLDEDPKWAAKYHCDTHVVKMVLEAAQLLSTCHRVLDGVPKKVLSAGGRNITRYILPDWREDQFYKSTHYNHPCSIWLRESVGNYFWTVELAKELLKEYKFRFGKVHGCTGIIHTLEEYYPDNIPSVDMTEPMQAVDDEYKVPGNPVQAYRKYYMGKKKDIAVWNHTEKPEWFNV